MWRMLIYLVAGFLLWQIVRYVLRLFVQPAAPQENLHAPVGRQQAPKRFDAVEEAEYEELDSKPKTPTN